MPEYVQRADCAVCQVRQTAVSRDGRIVLASCEDGTIWRWDKVRQTAQTFGKVGHDNGSSALGKHVLASCEDGTIWRLDKVSPRLWHHRSLVMKYNMIVLALV